MLEGQYEIFLDGRSYTAAEGAVVNLPRGIAHGFRNGGIKPARALFTVTPAESFEKFFDELSSLPPDAPPDPAKVAEIFGRYGIAILMPQNA